MYYVMYYGYWRRGRDDYDTGGLAKLGDYRGYPCSIPMGNSRLQAKCRFYKVSRTLLTITLSILSIKSLWKFKKIVLNSILVNGMVLQV